MAFSCIATSARDLRSINSSVSGSCLVLSCLVLSCLVLSCLAQEVLLCEVGKLEPIIPIISYHVSGRKY